MTQLLNGREYVTDLIDAVKNAEKRINLIALVITDDSSTANLISELKAAARRGVKVSMAVDIFFTYKELSDESSKSRYLVSQYKHVKKTRKELEKAGIKVRWLGASSIFLFSKRTHTKWSIVDDTVYAFGGVNLYSVGVNNNDYMFKFRNPELATRLSEEQALIIKSDKNNSAYRSHTINTEYGDILVDGGLPWDSIIYKRACDLALEAKEILFISQYCPTGRLNKIFKTKKTRLYFNNWKIASGLNRMQIFVNMKLVGLKTSYRHKKYLHAKYIIYTMPDGSKKAITGSHNFIWGGVVLGTREIALETADGHIISSLEKFFDKYIK